MYDLIVVGAGIVGLSTAWKYLMKNPKKKLLILDKAESVGFHQTGHNSGVIHCGIYYKPGSLKAQYCREGSQAVIDFCEQFKVPYRRPGKLIVAVKDKEIPQLEALYNRGIENGLKPEKWSLEQIKEREPHLQAKAGIYVNTTGTVDYKQVCIKLAEQIQVMGGDIHCGETVEVLYEQYNQVLVETQNSTFYGKYLVACGGLQSDRLAKLAGLDVTCQIVPFRGEYYKISDEKSHLVNHLIYPVPDPAFPFLGVHFTRMQDDSVKVGPNAVLAMAREGYSRRAFSLKDFSETLRYAGFWRLCGHYLLPGTKEQFHSLFKPLFVKVAQSYIPELRSADVHYSHSGIRAQALGKDGKLLDDFSFLTGKRSLHVVNAPSPAATACFPIADGILERLQQLTGKSS